MAAERRAIAAEYADTLRRLEAARTEMLQLKTRWGIERVHDCALCLRLPRIAVPWLASAFLLLSHPCISDMQRVSLLPGILSLSASAFFPPHCVAQPTPSQHAILLFL